jgi:type I restriction enzyme S subunit
MMKLTTLEETSDLITDGTHGSPKRTGNSTGIPLLSAKNVFDGEIRWDNFDLVPPSELDEFQKRACLKKGDVLMTCVGTIGRAAVWLNERPVVFFRSVAIIRPKSILRSEYLEYVIRSPDFQDELRRRTKRSSQGGVYLKDIKSMPIVVPQLAEQDRIVKLLDEADELRKLRAGANRRTADLTPALFHETFGDPIKGNRNWPMVKLEELCTIRRGASPRPIDKFLGGSVPWIKIGDGTKGDNLFIERTEECIITEGKSKSVYLEPGSLIFANCGVSLGFARILKIGGCIHDGWLALEKISLRLDKMFLLKLINFVTDHFRRIAPQGTQPNLNTGMLKNFRIPVPPLALQEDFAHRVTEIHELEARQAASRERLDALFQSMLHRAFRGEL